MARGARLWAATIYRQGVIDECAKLKAGAGWQFEGNAFYIALSGVNGLCPGSTVPLYRAYNNAMGGAPNRRKAYRNESSSAQKRY